MLVARPPYESHERSSQCTCQTGMLYGALRQRFSPNAIPLERRGSTPCRSRPPCGIQDRAFLRFGFRASPKLNRVGAGRGLSGRRPSAFVERVNLTLRQRVAALIRRTWSTAQDAPQLLGHLHWWSASYHFVRPHESLRVALPPPINRGGKRGSQRYRQRTPAIARCLASTSARSLS